jgi:hypothetical protein
MSGDQLQQVGRAIMQGAGAYAFQLALAAISPLSAAEMEKLQRMLQDMNKWSIDGCKKGQQWAQDLVGKAPSDVMNVWGEQSSLRQAVDGLSEDAFSSFFGNDKKSATKGMKELGIETDVNTLQDLIQNATYTNIFMNAFGGLKSGELLMTIYGTDIVKASNSSSDCPSSTAADGYCSVPLTGKLSDFFINLFINKKDLNSDDPYTFEYYSCANAKCTDVATKTYTGLERLRPKIKETLSSAWDHIRAGQPLTAPETSIAFLAGNDIPIMIQKYGPSIKDTYLDWKSTMMARKAMVQAVKNINDQLNEMISSDAPREFPLPGTVKLRENMATLQEGVAAESQLILEDEQRVLTRINTLMALRDAAR